jgi:predicted RNA-binding Zn ribbon-like protein
LLASWADAINIPGMEKNRSIATLMVVGGDPSLDFANTVTARRDRVGEDLLVDYDELLAWAELTGVLDADEAGRLRSAVTAPAGQAALRRARQLREAIYRVFSAVAAGEALPASDFAVLQREAGRAAAARELVRTAEGFAWRWRDRNHVDAVTLRVAHAAAELLVDRQLGRVKECFGRNCGWLFLDTSRNGLRRWCSEETCGTRGRVSRHRARQRARSSDGEMIGE